MIAALAKGRQVLQDKRYEEAAVKAVDFIYQKLIRQDGRLLARYREGEGTIPAYLDDYAYLTWGLLELYQATFNPQYLEKAIELTDAMLDLFGDEKEGGMFFYGRDGEELITRPKEIYDGAMPSGNSVALYNLLRIGRLTGRTEYEDHAAKQARFFSGHVDHYPAGYTFFLCALWFALAENKEIVVAGGSEAKDTGIILELLQREFLPEAVIAFSPYGNGAEAKKDLLPVLQEYLPVNGNTAVYVCRNYSCQEPVTGYEQMKDMLKRA